MVMVIMVKIEMVNITIVNIEHTQACFVQLWQRLEHTRRLFWMQHKRYCVRHLLKLWFMGEATDDMIWQVCRLSGIEGWSQLPSPRLCPRQHRELLRAIVSVRLGISFYRINLQALDAAYTQAFPRSTPINVNKKKATADKK